MGRLPTPRHYARRICGLGFHVWIRAWISETLVALHAVMTSTYRRGFSNHGLRLFRSGSPIHRRIRSCLDHPMIHRWLLCGHLKLLVFLVTENCKRVADIFRTFRKHDGMRRIRFRHAARRILGHPIKMLVLTCRSKRLLNSVRKFRMRIPEVFRRTFLHILHSRWKQFRQTVIRPIHLFKQIHLYIPPSNSSRLNEVQKVAIFKTFTRRIFSPAALLVPLIHITNILEHSKRIMHVIIQPRRITSYLTLLFPFDSHFSRRIRHLLRQFQIHRRRLLCDSACGSTFRQLSLLASASFLVCTAESSKVEQVRLQGDLLLGGLFPMHEVGQPPDRPCGPIKEEKGIQRMEAMLYALDHINKDPGILPNLTLGALILDTCSSDTYALEQSMEFVKASLTSLEDSEYRCEDGRKPLYTPRRPVVGVVGASSSSVSVMVANILRLFKIPQVSYASTSVELSDKGRFGYFSRVVPPDNFQAQALVDVVQRLGWNYVSTVAVEGDYGEKGIESFKSRAERAGICIAVSEKISRNSKAEDFDKIIASLFEKKAARAVVLFVDEDNCRKLLAASARAGRTGHFLWLGSDSWGAKVHPVRDQETVARSAITVLPKRHNIQGFDRYFLSLRPSSNTRDPWFKPFWKQHFNCTFKEGPTKRGKCTGTESLNKYEQEGLVPFVVDAVYAVAHALHRLLEDHCGSPSVFCAAVRPIPQGELLLKYIRNVSFPSPQGGGLWVRFNSDGDAPGSYRIYQYQEIEQGRFEYHVIGEWSEKLTLNVDLLQWPDEANQSGALSGSGYSGHAPVSVCSPPCALGFSRTFQSQRCCWLCVQCREEEYISNDTCVACLPGYLPNMGKTACEKMPVEYMTWDSPWAIVPAALASVGIAATMGTVSIFVRYNGTPIIMASGRELCYVLLIGLLLCYSISFVILAKPARVTCAVLRVGVGICLSICYSAVFTKTNRISRIFNRGIRSSKRPSYTSPRSQVVICLGLVSVQLVFTVTWLVVEPPGVREVYPTRSSAVLQCGISSISLMMSLIYNMLLILLCTTYAFKTRKIPENFNEAKYIGFTMYSTCIVWLAFVPIYFGTNNDYKIQIASLCTCISISASVVLGCLFLPKVYIVIYQPYKNVRPGSQGTASFQPGAGVMRFARPHSSAAALASVATAAVIGASPGPRPAAILVPAPPTTTGTTLEGSSVSRDDEDSPRPCRTNGELTSPSVEESSLS